MVSYHSVVAIDCRHNERHLDNIAITEYHSFVPTNGD